MLSKNRDNKWLLAEGARLERAVVDADGRQFDLTAEPVDENREWGGIQEDTERGYGTALARPDLATGEWTSTEKYADNDAVPEGIVNYLATEYDADLEVDLSKLGVSLTVAEDVIEAGDEIKIAGKVESKAAPGATGGTPEQAAATDGGARRPTVNLTPGATVTGDSWRALVWTETKFAAKLPAGLAMIAMGLAAPVLILSQLGVISLGLGL